MGRSAAGLLLLASIAGACAVRTDGWLSMSDSQAMNSLKDKQPETGLKSCESFMALLSTKDLLTKCSTVVLSSPLAAAELKGNLETAEDFSSRGNDLILEDKFISSGWVTIYHKHAPYLEHNSHYHVHCSEMTYAKVTENPDERLSPSLCFWDSKETAQQGIQAPFCVYFPPFCDWSQQPCKPYADNKKWFKEWVEKHGMEFDL